MWIYLRAYHICNKSSIIDVCLSSKYSSAFWRLFKYFISLKYIRPLIHRHPKILKFQSEAKLEQTIAIVTTHSVFLLGLTSWPVRESALQMLLSRILLLIDVGTGSLSSDSQQWYFAMLMAFSSNWFFHSTSC